MVDFTSPQSSLLRQRSRIKTNTSTITLADITIDLMILMLSGASKERWNTDFRYLLSNMLIRLCGFSQQSLVVKANASGMTFPKEFVFHAYEPFPSPHFAKPGMDLEVYRVSGSVDFVSQEVDHALLSPVFRGFAQVVDHRLGRASLYWLKNLAPLSLETLKTSKYSGDH